MLCESWESRALEWRESCREPPFGRYRPDRRIRRQRLGSGPIQIERVRDRKRDGRDGRNAPRPWQTRGMATAVRSLLRCVPYRRRRRPVAHAATATAVDVLSFPFISQPPAAAVFGTQYPLLDNGLSPLLPVRPFHTRTSCLLCFFRRNPIDFNAAVRLQVFFLLLVIILSYTHLTLVGYRIVVLFLPLFWIFFEVLFGY